MKRLYTLLSFLLLLSATTQVSANKVIVKGTVKFNNGTAAANVSVLVATDSATTSIGCAQNHVVYTNSNGYYQDTLTCLGSDIIRVHVSLGYVCNTEYVRRNIQVPPGNVVESNFSLTCAPFGCQATFTITKDSTSTKIHYNSVSAHGVNENDMVTRRKWKFGDGDTLGGNVVEPVHTYVNKGVYLTCLTIWTTSGCETSSCQTISTLDSIPPSPPAPPKCEAGFTYMRDSNSLAVRYNSSNAHGTNSADKIIRRRWKFGDGDTLGNNVDPVHTFKKPGVYQTCLTIWTAAGCENTVCKTISIVDSVPPPPTTRCEAAFSFRGDSASLVVRFNSSNAHGISSTDKIIRRRWKFGDGDTLGINVDPVHTFKKPGIYQTCLTIWTAAGCENTVCKTISIVDSTPRPAPPVVQCDARFVFEILPTANIAGTSVRFNSKTSIVAPGDSIRERIWKFGDGTTGTTIDPIHVYAAGGTYNACLIIRSKNGCSDTTCINVKVPTIAATGCKSGFTYLTDGANIKLNSNTSIAGAGDSIISRRWIFGDSSAISTNVDPAHRYAKSGVYNVCLYIKTARGCESKECKQITVTVPGTTPPAATKCAARFTSSRVSLKKFSFNSSMSVAPANDTIVERNWGFGDGSAALTGNVANPSKEFAKPGTYTVCLKIRTAKGCDNYYCSTVRIEDTTTVPPTTEPIKIVSVRPNPVASPLATEVWSKFNNISAELAIYDIYGVRKWGTSKVLLQGNNITSIPTGFLLPGPYFFRVTTMYGVKSVQFYKL